MMSKYQTIDGRYYHAEHAKYKVNWKKAAASQYQTKCRNFFYYLWGKTDLVLEEFVIRPRIYDRYRLDLYNVDKKIAVEIHGQFHIEHSIHFHKTEEKFWESVERDVLKAEWCQVNGIELVEIYPSNLPLTMKWLEKQYPQIQWDLRY